MTLRDRYMERTDFMESQEKEIVYVNRLNGWQKFRIWIGNIVLILIPVGVFIYLRTKKII